MEEDIEILEEIIQYCKEHLPPYYKDRDLKAIENLIKGYREKEAKIKDLEQINEAHKTINCELNKINKQQIKDIEEELNNIIPKYDKALKEYLESDSNELSNYSEVRYYEGEKAVVERLLKKGNKENGTNNK